MKNKERMFRHMGAAMEHLFLFECQLQSEEV